MEALNAERNEYEVEAVLNKRLHPGGKYEYLIKWKNFSIEEATWEPVEFISGAAGVVLEFERRHELKQQAIIDAAKANGEYDEPNQPMGYERQLPMAHVIAATDKTRDGCLVYLVQWEGCRIVDFVLADEVCEKDPLAVMRFYEKKMGWKDWGGPATVNPRIHPSRVIGNDTRKDGRTLIKIQQEGVRRHKMVPLEFVREHHLLLLIKFLQNRFFPRR